MTLGSRIKKLESQLFGNQEQWVVFTIGFYENSHEREIAKRRLIDEHTDRENPKPTHCVFINEVPGISTSIQEEKFLLAFER